MKSLPEVRAAVERLTLPNRLVIDGRHVAAADGTVFDNITPRNGTVLNQIPRAGRADVDLAVAAARTAFEDGRWRNLAPRAKKAILFALADRMESETDALALMESLDTGRSAEHTSELQSLMRTSYAVFCLTKNKRQ